MRCNPWRWLWGLLLIAPASWIVLNLHQTEIENELRVRTTEALERAGLSWAATSFSGRDAVLTGLAAEEGEPSKAADLVRNVWGVRKVDARTDLVQAVPAFTWTAEREENGTVRLSGFVPTEASRKTILQAARRALPSARIDDQMKLARGGPDRDLFAAAAGFGLKQLAALENGRAELHGMKFSISGVAPDQTSLSAVRSSLKSLPAGLVLAKDGLSGPKIDPYVWGAIATAKQLSLSGYVPSGDMRDGLFRKAKTLFPDRAVIDRVEIGDGAPAGFEGAVTLGLEQLKQLKAGEFSLSGNAAMLEGEAADQAIADAVTRTFTSAVGAPLTAQARITAPEPPPSPPAAAPEPAPVPSPPPETVPVPAAEPVAEAPPAAPVAPPIYSTTARIEGGQIELTGNVPSEDERIAVVAATRGRFPDLSVKDSFEVISGADDGWRACLMAGLTGLGRLKTGELSMSGLSVTVKGVTDDDDIAKVLPEDVKTAASSNCQTTVEVTSTGEKQAEARRRAEEEARLQEEARRKEEEQQRLAAEMEAKRKADEEAAARAAEEARLAAAKAEEGARIAAKRAEADKCEARVTAAIAKGVINFKRADWALDMSSKPTLDEIAAIVNECPAFTITIEGHTDSEGIPERNNPLSERRAKAVSDYLISAGVDPARISSIGYGADRPIADNATPEGRAKNRRIELKINVQ
ncbi:MAG: OmpA family protein [Hyphomicrobium sp.]|nr:OmpA family protein [Hyphomicrobium sp.]